MKPDSELLLLHHSNCSSPPYLLCWQRCKPVRSGNPLSTRCSSEMQKFRLVVVHRWDEADRRSPLRRSGRRSPLRRSGIGNAAPFIASSREFSRRTFLRAAKFNNASAPRPYASSDTIRKEDLDQNTELWFIALCNGKNADACQSTLEQTTNCVGSKSRIVKSHNKTGIWVVGWFQYCSHEELRSYTAYAKGQLLWIETSLL